MRLRAILPLALLALVAACGGSGTSSPSGAASPAAPTSASTSASAAAAASVAGTAEACALVSSDEVALDLGAPALGATSTGSGSSDVSVCTWHNGPGDTIAVLTYTKTGGHAALGALSATPGVQKVTDLGDGAVFDPTSATLTVVKGDALLAIVAGAPSDSTDRRLVYAKQLAKSALTKI